MRDRMKWSQALFVLVFVGRQLTASEISVVQDPVGEEPVFCSQGCGQGLTVQPFQDIVRAEVSRKDREFRFVLEVADEIAASPPLEPPGIKLLEWSFRLDMDPTTFTHGYPFSPAPLGDFADIMILVVWDGVGYTASVIDRRPSLTGGENVVTPIAFDLKRRQVTASVEAALIGDPANFLWRAFTQAWTGDLGTDSWRPLDIAPSGVHVFASWPADLTSAASIEAAGLKVCLVHSDCPGNQTCDTSTCVAPPTNCAVKGTCDLCWGVCTGDASDCRPRCRF